MAWDQIGSVTSRVPDGVNEINAHSVGVWAVKFTVKIAVNKRIVNDTTGKTITSAIGKVGRKEMFYLTTHSTHFIYGYMASDIWLRTILIVRKKTCCRHIGYSFRLTARVLLYAPSHRQDSTYHGSILHGENPLSYFSL